MTKILKFISKNFGKLALLLSLSSNSKESILLVVIILTSLYLSSNSKTIKKYLNKINKFSGNHEDENKHEHEHEDEHEHQNHHENHVDNILEKTLDSNIIKKNIKSMINKIDKKNKYNFKKQPYENNIQELQDNYDGKNNDYNFSLNVNNATCSTPIFNLRTYGDIPFHFNFLIHNFCPKKINSLIMTKDIQKWMSSASLTEDDLCDDLLPIYFVKKSDGVSNVYEYLKVFIHTDSDNNKIAFVQKGDDYYAIKEDIDELIEKDIIKDLLNGLNYYSYNLYTPCSRYSHCLN